jgi:hypothetical protein
VTEPQDRLLAALDDGVQGEDGRAVVACDAETFLYGISLYNATGRELTITVISGANSEPAPEGDDEMLLRLSLHPALSVVRQSADTVTLDAGEGEYNAVEFEVEVDELPTRPRVLISRLLNEYSADGVTLRGDLREATVLGCASEDG